MAVVSPAAPEPMTSTSQAMASICFGFPEAQFSFR